jgi:opacity protein-like surface antigen
MGRKRLALGLWLLLLPAPPAGAEGEGYARPGIYVAADFVLGDEDFKQTLESKPFFQDSYEISPGPAVAPPSARTDIISVTCCSLSTNMNVGVNGRVGYRLHPRLALEAEVNWMNPWNLKSEVDFSSNRNDPIPFSGNFRVEPIVLTGNAKFYLLTGRFQPFVSVGSGAYYLDVEDKGLGARNAVLPQYVVGYQPTPPNTPNFDQVNDINERRSRLDLPCNSSSNPRDTSGLDPDGRTRNCAGVPPFDIEQWSFAMRFRGGFEFYATENVVVHFGVTYVLPTGGRVKDFDYLTYDVFGIMYRF